MLDASHDAPHAAAGWSPTRSDAAGAWLCARCRHRITHEHFVATLAGAHAHTRSNPHGFTFSFRIFAAAPGAHRRGLATVEDSWFPPHAWDHVHCSRCGTHLGWCFTTADTPRGYGLINESLQKEQDR